MLARAAVIWAAVSPADAGRGYTVAIQATGRLDVLVRVVQVALPAVAQIARDR